MMETNAEYKQSYAVTICSGKGGVGKSVLAANIAQALASKGLRVLLWDADMNFPNQHLIIGVEPPVRLSEVYSGNVPVSMAIHKVRDNFYLLADTPAAGVTHYNESNSILNVYEQILSESNFDIILIDAPAGGTQDVLQCCNIADLVEIVVTDEPTSLLDAYALIKLLLGFIEPKYINLLVNNVIDFDDADDISSKFNKATEKFLGVHLEAIGFVPYNRIVRQSILRQDLFILQEPESDVSEAIRNISEVINSKLEIGINA